ncbi:MAG TPA: BamA/TamA family outer membrane protein [Steroidobacteraceae bacterium]|nr:BamA/TamA family outer membrane protein [Steroidobacteraceae bacterium]
MRLLLVNALLAVPAFGGLEVEVRGVEQEDIRNNVLAYLSFERYKDSDDLSPEFVERLQERSEREVRSALRPFGYYEPTVTTQVVRENGKDQDYRVTVNVVPGKPVVVESVDVKVTGPGASDRVFTSITSDLPIQVGDRLSHANYESLKGGLLRAAATYGYLDARMLKNEMRVDPRARTADVTLEFETGEQYKFGATTIDQDTIDESLARRFLRYQEGDKFNATELLRTQFALDDSLYFSTVEVLPEDRDRETHTVPIGITAEPNRRHRIQYGVGYGTDTQTRGTVSWEDRRVNSSGHRFRTEMRAAALEQSLDSSYIVPIGDPATEKFTLQLAGEHERLADIDDQSINFTPGVTHVRHSWFGRNDWQRVTYLELLDTRSKFVESDRVEEQTLLIPGISFALVPPNYLGEALFSRALFLELRGSHSSLGSDSNFLQAHVQAERVFDFAWAPKWHVYMRGEVGATALSRTSGLAPSQRFFAGGDRSVRGFGLNALSPVAPATNADGSPRLDEDGNPVLEKVGGKHMLAASVELIRDLPWKSLSVAVFGDVGNAFDEFGDPLMYSVGVGVRLRLPVVSVGIDVAQALTIPPGSTERPGPRLHLNFSPKL